MIVPFAAAAVLALAGALRWGGAVRRWGSYPIKIAITMMNTKRSTNGTAMRPPMNR